MSISSIILTVSDIPVEIIRKDIKNLHLGVYPPNGLVRVSAPAHITIDNVRLAVISRLPWIKRQREEFEKQPRQTEREYVASESHYYWGSRYLLEVIERVGKQEVILENRTKMILYVRPGTHLVSRELTINNWYRSRLKEAITPLLDKWQPIIGRTAQSWGVKRMKTKWGSCNIAARRIWLNLELAKKPPECLEYILVHELVHLHERNHDRNFKELMDRFLPDWRTRRDILKKEPLAHENWDY